MEVVVVVQPTQKHVTGPFASVGAKWICWAMGVIVVKRVTNCQILSAEITIVETNSNIMFAIPRPAVGRSSWLCPAMHNCLFCETLNAVEFKQILPPK